MCVDYVSIKHYLAQNADIVCNHVLETDVKEILNRHKTGLNESNRVIERDFKVNKGDSSDEAAENLTYLEWVQPKRR